MSNRTSYFKMLSLVLHIDKYIVTKIVRWLLIICISESISMNNDESGQKNKNMQAVKNKIYIRHIC